MKAGNPKIKETQVKFSKENQPSPKAKSEGRRRIRNIKEAIEFFGNQLKAKVNVEGEEVELTFESNIAYQLYKKANEGDLKAIELIMKVIPNFVVPTKVSNTDPEGNAMPMTKEDIEMMRIFNEHHSNIQKSE